MRRTLYFDVLDIVSSLINLMKDQASHLNSRGISAISYSLTDVSVTLRLLWCPSKGHKHGVSIQNNLVLSTGLIV